jgi:CDP-diacylglycerol--glycerol-3-phosphate 3-phosphatidyltransferase
MKYIPNLITIIRIILSLVILTTIPLSPSFFILYFICGLSDILDGYIARKTKSTSKLGANLDGLADFIFIAVILFSIIPILDLPIWSLVIMGLIAIIRIISQIIGWLRYHQLAFLHTFLNKATGLSLFISPILLIIFTVHITLIILLTLAILSAMEDLYLNLTEEKLNLNNKGIFFK